MSISPILSRPVLVLNRNWAPIGEATVQSSITDLTGWPHPSKLAMNIEMERDADGNWRLTSGTSPVSWDEWIQLPIRDDHHEDASLGAHRFNMRVPTVIICSVYNEMPVKRPRLSPGAIWARDDGTCQYTGRKLPRSQMNLDHVVPRDRGGRDTWENLVLSDKEINSRKGNRLNHEVGLRLIRVPKAPPAVPASITIRVAKHVTWVPFLPHLHGRMAA